MNLGSAAMFAVGSANPIVAGATTGILIDVLDESVGRYIGTINGNALKGTRSHFSNRCREGDKIIGGAFRHHPVASDLAYMMIKVMGGGSATVPALAETIPSFVVQKKTGGPAGTTVYTYPAMYVNRFTLEGSYGQPVTATYELVGTTDEATGSTFPTITANATTGMFIFSDLTLTLGGTAYNCKSFRLTIDNGLVQQRVNSRVATAVNASDRVIVLSHTLPESEVAISTFTDVELAAVLSLSYSNQSAVFTMPVVRYSQETPHVTGRDEIDYPLNGQALATAALNEMTAAIDSTP